MHVWEWTCSYHILGAILTEHTKYETLHNTRSKASHLGGVIVWLTEQATQDQNFKLQLLKPLNPKLHSLHTCSVTCPVFQGGKLSFQK